VEAISIFGGEPRRGNAAALACAAGKRGGKVLNEDRKAYIQVRQQRPERYTPRCSAIMNGIRMELAFYTMIPHESTQNMRHNSIDRLKSNPVPKANPQGTMFRFIDIPRPLELPAHG
jgi:hypothetical protein